jgi:hypothetical protein
VLRGDLASSPLEHLLAELATDAVTGCLYIADPEGGEVHLYVTNGQLVGVRPVPSRDPLGPRLVSAGLVDAEQLSAALSALDGGGRPAVSLADVLLEPGDADLAPVESAHVDTVAEELALDIVERIDGWTSGAWRFRRRLQPARPLSDPIGCAHLVQLVVGRRAERDELARRLSPEGLALAELVPTLGQLPEVADEAGLHAAARRFIDGQRCVGEIARLTGYSELALGRLLAEQQEREAAEQQERHAAEAREAQEAAEASSGTAEAPGEVEADDKALDNGTPDGDTPDDDAPSRLTTADLTLDDLTPTDSWNRIADDEEVGASLAKASEALSQLMGEGLVEEEPETSLQPVRSSKASAPAAVEPADREAAARRERLRAAAAAELAAAHAEAEEARRAAETPPLSGQGTDSTESVELTVTPLRPATLEGARAAQAALSLLSQDMVTPVADPRSGPAATPQTEQDPTPPRSAVPAQRSVANTADSQLAAALLREMASERVVAPAGPVETPIPASSSNPDVTAAAPNAPLPSGPRMGMSRPSAPSGAADTAALLRELSSLGGEEAGPGGPRPSQRPGLGTAPGQAGGRRRKGLWGRG